MIGLVYMWKFIVEVREELKHVVWPTKEDVFKATWIILINVILVSIFLFFTDFIFEKVFHFLVDLGTR